MNKKPMILLNMFESGEVRQSSTNSHDCIYSSPSLIELGLSTIQPLVKKWKKFGVIDFSAGDNAFCKRMKSIYKDRLTTTLAVDLQPTDPSVEKKSWFDVDSIDPRPDHLVIGFNPPFGYRGKFAKEFLEHALEFQPDIIMSIVPNALRNTKLPKYKKVECQLLDPKTSYITKNLIFGTYLCVWVRDEDVVHSPRKRRKNLVTPDGIQHKSTHSRDVNISWRGTPNRLWIRRSGYNPGLKVVLCDGDKKLYMISKDCEFKEIVDEDEINNNIMSYCSFTITDVDKWRWYGDSPKNLLEELLEKFKALNFVRVSMMPYLSIYTIWEIVEPFIIKITSTYFLRT